MASYVELGKLGGKLWNAGKSFIKSGGKALKTVVDKTATYGGKLEGKLSKAAAEAKSAREAQALEKFNATYGKHTFTPKGGTIIYNKANSVFYSTKGGTVTQRFVKDGSTIKDLKYGRNYTEKDFEAWYRNIQTGWKNSRTQAETIAAEKKALEKFNATYGKYTYTPKGGTVTQRFGKDGNVIKDLKNGRTYTEQGFEAWYKGLQAGWKNSRTQAAEAVIKAAEAAGHTAKEGAASGKSFLEKARIAGKYGEQGTVKGWAAVKEVGRTSRSVLKFGAEHPFVSVIAAHAVAKRAFGYDGGIIRFALSPLNYDKDEGAISAIKKEMFGVEYDEAGNEKDVAVIKSILDQAFGNGTYDNIAGGLGQAGNELGNFYQGAKDLALRGGEEVAGAYNGVKERMANGYGNGFVLDDNGNPIGDPSAEQMPVPGGSNISNTLSNMLGNVTNGNISKLDLASLLVSSYLMFGKFGWMGKATSLLLGSSTLHKINDRRVPVQELGRQQEAAQRSSVQAQQQAEEEVEREYVHRYR